MGLNIGLIRVVTFEDKELLHRHGEILEKKFTGFQVESRCIKNQYEGIYDEITEIQAINKIVKLAKEFELEKKDAILISCAADPALEETKKELIIPVIGAGSSCAAIALAYGKRVGVIGIGKEITSAMEGILGDYLVEYIQPEGVSNTLDLLKPQNRSKIIDASVQLKNKGCDTIALCCTGMATIGIADEIKEKVKLPVVDPIIASGIVINNIKDVYYNIVQR